MFSQKMLDTLEKDQLRLMLKPELAFFAALFQTIQTQDYKDTQFKDEQMFTAATDGLHCWINEDWYLPLDDDTRIGVLLHEMLHVAFIHPFRGKMLTNNEARNIAFDAIVNHTLEEMGLATKYLRTNAVWRPDLKQWSEEEIYFMLLKNQKQMQKAMQMFGMSSGQGNQQSKNQPGDQPGSNNPNSGKLMPGDVRNCSSEADSAHKMQQVIQNVCKAADTARQAGTQSLQGILNNIDNLLKPKLDWKKLLHRFFDSWVYGARRTWRRPNRRYPDVYRPSRDKEKVALKELQVYLDVSSSVSDEEIREYLTEIQEIQKRVKPKKITMLFFDTQIIHTEEMTEKTDIKTLKYPYGGGTDLQEVHQHIKETKPDIAIIFSDMWVNIPPKPNNFTAFLWIKVGKGGNTPDYGKVIDYDRKEEIT